MASTNSNHSETSGSLQKSSDAGSKDTDEQAAHIFSLEAENGALKREVQDLKAQLEANIVTLVYVKDHMSSLTNEVGQAIVDSTPWAQTETPVSVKDA